MLTNTAQDVQNIEVQNTACMYGRTLKTLGQRTWLTCMVSTGFIIVGSSPYAPLYAFYTRCRDALVVMLKHNACKKGTPSIPCYSSTTFALCFPSNEQCNSCTFFLVMFLRPSTKLHEKPMSKFFCNQQWYTFQIFSIFSCRSTNAYKYFQDYQFYAFFLLILSFW